MNPAALRAIRVLSGHTQASLARASGVSQGHISQLESSDKNASPVTLKKLARALRVPIAALLRDPVEATAAEVRPPTRR